MSIVKVAEEAGVSKSTVSRVINQVPGVTESARQAVLEAMEKLGYQPSARRPGPKPASRRGIRTGNVLMLVLGFEPHEVYRMPVFPSILHGVEVALRETGMNLVLAGYHPDQALPAALASDQVDGVLLMGRATTLNQTVRGKLQNMPAVGLLTGFDEVAGLCDSALYNNRAIGPLAAGFLLKHGHKHVAFLSPSPDHPAFNRRRADFKAAMEQAGVSVLELISEVDRAHESIELIRPLIQRLKKAKPQVTACCCASDAVLPTMYEALKEVGVQPVKDLDIISCDNEEQIIRRLNPRPSTIDIRADLIGRQAVRQLIWRLANPEEPSRITVLVEPILVPAD